jgi:hypothetical protein
MRLTRPFAAADRKEFDQGGVLVPRKLVCVCSQPRLWIEFDLAESQNVSPNSLAKEQVFSCVRKKDSVSDTIFDLL